MLRVFVLCSAKSPELQEPIAPDPLDLGIIDEHISSLFDFWRIAPYQICGQLPLEKIRSLFDNYRFLFVIATITFLLGLIWGL